MKIPDWGDEADVRLANVIKAITKVMPCSECPYPCMAKEHSSQANCDRHWYEILQAAMCTTTSNWSYIVHLLMEN